MKIVNIQIYLVKTNGIVQIFGVNGEYNMNIVNLYH